MKYDKERPRVKRHVWPLSYMWFQRQRGYCVGVVVLCCRKWRAERIDKIYPDLSTWTHLALILTDSSTSVSSRTFVMYRRQFVFAPSVLVSDSHAF